jgi:hypothetical protein
MSIEGTGALLRRLAMAFVGTFFIAIGGWVFMPRAAADLRTGRTVITTANRVGVTWSHAYGLRNHPVYFALSVLTNALGALGFAGLGLLVLYVVVRTAFDPSGANVSARARRIASAGTFIAVGSLILFFGLQVFPYLLRYGVLQID